MTPFCSSMEESEQWSAFKQFLRKTEGSLLRFVGLYTQITTLLRVQVHTAPGSDVVDIVDV